MSCAIPVLSPHPLPATALPIHLSPNLCIPYCSSHMLFSKEKTKQTIFFSFTFQTTESTPTYADVIRQGFNHIRHLDDAFKTVHQRHCREMKDFDQHQWKEKQEFLRKEKQLLSEKGEKLNQLLTPHLDVLYSSDKSSSLS
ncbi:unnamed protein product [Eretmochelys imbricata]